MISTRSKTRQSHLAREKETTAPTTIMACRSNGTEHPRYPLKARHRVGMALKRSDKRLREHPLQLARVQCAFPLARSRVRVLQRVEVPGDLRRSTGGAGEVRGRVVS
jgi:hypothetical protein